MEEEEGGVEGEGEVEGMGGIGGEGGRVVGDWERVGEVKVKVGEERGSV